MSTICYTIVVDENTSGNLDHVTKVVHEIVNDKKYSSFVFEQVTFQEWLVLRQSEFKDRAFLIRLSTQDTIEKICHFTGLSCADTIRGTIFLNETNWNKGDEIYKQHVVAHEIAHLLGFGHSTCSGIGNMGSVTQEFTRLGWQGCIPTRYINLPN